MATIGTTSDGGFIEDPGSNLTVIASKYTASNTFTPTFMGINFSEQWGINGTVYTAIYSDSSGIPGTKLFDGSTTYASLFNGWKIISVTGVQLNSGTDYWLCVYFVKSSGTFNIDVDVISSSGNTIKEWTEVSAGSWTDNPTSSNGSSNKLICIYGTDETTTTTSTTISTSSTSKTVSTSSSSISSSTSISTTSSSITTTSSSNSITITTSSSSSSITTTSSSSSTSLSTSTTVEYQVDDIILEWSTEITTTSTTSSSSSSTSSSSSSSSVTTTSSSSSVSITTTSSSSSSSITISTTSSSITTTSSSLSTTSSSSSSSSTTTSSSSISSSSTSSTIVTSSSSSSSMSTSTSVTVPLGLDIITIQPDFDIEIQQESYDLGGNLVTDIDIRPDE